MNLYTFRISNKVSSSLNLLSNSITIYGFANKFLFLDENKELRYVIPKEHLAFYHKNKCNISETYKEYINEYYNKKICFNKKCDVKHYIFNTKNMLCVMEQKINRILPIIFRKIINTSNIQCVRSNIVYPINFSACDNCSGLINYHLIFLNVLKMKIKNDNNNLQETRNELHVMEKFVDLYFEFLKSLTFDIVPFVSKLNKNYCVCFVNKKFYA